MVNIDLPAYTPRPWQYTFDKEFHHSGKNRAFLIWARRHGKDVACWNHLISRAMLKPGSYYYIYPVQTQAKKAIWEGMTSDGRRFLDFIPRELLDGEPNNTEMRIKLINGSIIRILGSDNHDALRSSNPIGVVFSEFAWHNPQTWPMVIEPILLENKGWALFNTTPSGKNHAYDLWNRAKTRENWYTSFVSNKESRLFSDKDLQELKENSGISEEIIQQEYYCSFDRGIDGSYYGRILNELRMKGRFNDFDSDNYSLVHTSADIGYGDSTAIWWYQMSGNEIHFLDYYENYNEGISHYINVMAEKRIKNNWTYGTHSWPHDAGSGSFDTGMSKAKRAYELGLNVIVLPRDRHVSDGIERVRKWLPKCYFSVKRCEKGIKCLEAYRKKRDEKNNCYYEEPLHDWSSHGADAFRYACQSIEQTVGNGSVSLDEYRKMKMQFGVGGTQNNNSILGN
jgi:phage terminase large subunit